MDIEIWADLKCSVFPNNQLFKSDNGKGSPQAINNIVDDFVWRIEFIIWADNFCQRIDRKFLFVIQNEIRQEQEHWSALISSPVSVPLGLMISIPPKKLIWTSSGLYLEAFVAARIDCCCLTSLTPAPLHRKR